MAPQSSYSLENPISLVTGKDREDLTLDDLILVIEKKQIEAISFLYPALDGRLKQLRIPITSRRQAEQILAEGERVDGSSLFKGILDVSLSDQSCAESSAILLENRHLYERENIFPPAIIEYVSHLLKQEEDENMNQYLSGLPADDRLLETRRIMHRSLHRH